MRPGSVLEVMAGVPANANSNQRFLTVEAFQRAGFQVLGLLNEPSAAAIEPSGMTTFWLSFTDSEATADKRFLGVAIFDMDESAGELSTTEIIKHAWALGVNPGGAVSVQEVGSIPDEHKNKLITDDALLLSLGSRGRQNQH